MTEPENFKNLDMEYRFAYKSDLLHAVNSLGYEFISECIWKEYYKNKKSLREIGNLLQTSEIPVVNAMRRWKFPRRSKGGANYKGKISNALVQKVMKYKGKKSGIQVAERFNLSKCSVYKIWREN